MKDPLQGPLTHKSPKYIVDFCLIKGYCSPPEEDENASGEGATQFEDIQDGGLGAGDGVKDVSDQIETEDQVKD